MKRAREREQKAKAIGRDEMNLVEFPYFTLSRRAPRGVGSVEFSDEVRHRGECIRRRVIIQGDPKYGLPTAREEEVTLALLAITKDKRFRDPRVEFCQAEVLSTLGWGRETKDYKRLERSFFTLNGARYHVEGWRDNKQKTYTTKGSFSLIGDFELRDSRKCVTAGRRRRDLRPERERVLSYFYWGPVLFKSFQDGYLRKLDFLTVRNLKHTSAKRLYRYLGKHFHPPRVAQLTVDLKELALLRIGIRQSADLAAIRMELQAAIRELEAISFIKSVPWADRCRKVKAGVYEVTFECPCVADQRKGGGARGADVGVDRELVDALIERGVSRRGRTAASALVSQCPGGGTQIREVVGLFDAKLKRGEKVGPGFIVEGIRREEPYHVVANATDRAGLKSPATRPSPPSGEVSKPCTELRRTRQAEQRRAAVDAFLADKSEADRDAIWQAALVAASDEARGYYKNAQKMRAFLGEARCNVLHEYVTAISTRPSKQNPEDSPIDKGRPGPCK